MDDFNSLTVVELKQLLREQGLSVSGKKSELISISFEWISSAPLVYPFITRVALYMALCEPINMMSLLTRVFSTNPLGHKQTNYSLLFVG